MTRSSSCHRKAGGGASLVRDAQKTLKTTKEFEMGRTEAPRGEDPAYRLPLTSKPRRVSHSLLWPEVVVCHF